MVGPIEICDKNHLNICTPTKTILLENDFSLEKYNSKQNHIEYKFYHPIRGNSCTYSASDDQNLYNKDHYMPDINDETMYGCELKESLNLLKKSRFNEFKINSSVSIKDDHSKSPFRANDEISDDITNSFWNYLQRRNRIDPSWKDAAFEKAPDWIKTPNDKSPEKCFKSNKYVKESPYQRNKLKQETDDKWTKKPPVKLNRNSFLKPSNTRTTIAKSNPKRKTMNEKESKAIYGIKATRDTRYKNKNSICGNSVYANVGINAIQYTICGKQLNGPCLNQDLIERKKSHSSKRKTSVNKVQK